MKLQAKTIWTAISLLGLATLSTTAVQAAVVDGQITSTSEYEWNTTTPNSKWNTHGGTAETNDGSGGDAWDINYLGTTIGNGEFQFGAVGGSILSGSNVYNSTTLTLSDIAINVVEAGETVTDPAASSAGWDYALRLMSIDDAGNALFSLFSMVGVDGATWQGSGTNATTATYQNQQYSYGSTETFRMVGGLEVASGISGKYTANSADNGVLEGSFDLGLLGLFDEQAGGSIITYLTMSCVNDEAIVGAEISAVPVPAAFWLFGSALVGLAEFGKRRKTA